MRLVVAISLLCYLGCDSGSSTTAAQPPAAKPVFNSALPFGSAASPGKARLVEVRLARSAGLPRFDIQATFGADQDPAPHIQPIAAALAGARTACSRNAPALAAKLELEVRGKRLHAAARNPSAACLARAIDGTTIEDPIDYKVELLVSVG
jgi:hypothetical protein